MKKQITHIGLPLAVTGALVGAGCASDAGDRDPSATATSAAYITTWTGHEAVDFSFPGRVVLPVETCERWSTANPQPGKLTASGLFLVVDARNNRPQNCDPDSDTGAGRYAGASTESKVQPDPNGERYARDGTVVKVLAAQIGQFACNHDGTSGSDLWLQVWNGHTGDQAFMISASNVGFVELEQVQRANIPITPGPYQDTRQGGC